MPFRLSLSLCCVVCLLSYTAEMEQTVRPRPCTDHGTGRGDIGEDSEQFKTGERQSKHALDQVNLIHNVDLPSVGTHTVLPGRVFKPDFFVQLDSGA